MYIQIHIHTHICTCVGKKELEVEKKKKKYQNVSTKILLSYKTVADFLPYAFRYFQLFCNEY